ncbi:hypothetical protein HOY80DRAFT_1041641 [Tuber brumale]|nr:hypothetical protein HOY80DRAFT_1041641 [Tuber brumale]
MNVALRLYPLTRYQPHLVIITVLEALRYLNHEPDYRIFSPRFGGRHIDSIPRMSRLRSTNYENNPKCYRQHCLNTSLLYELCRKPYHVEEENDDSAPRETLSYAFSGFLTATLDSNSISEDSACEPAGSSVVTRSNMSGMNFHVPSAFLPKQKARKGHCWLPSNVMEVFDNGNWCWLCARCPRIRAPVHSDSSTKNMNLHLAGSHGVTKEYPDCGQNISSIAGESRMVVAIGRTVAPRVQFNSDIFKQLRF